MPEDRPQPAPAPADGSVPIRSRGLEGLGVGDRVVFTDTRGAKRGMTVVATVGDCLWAEAAKTAYVAPGIRFRLDHAHAAKRSRRRSCDKIEVGNLSPQEQALTYLIATSRCPH